MYFTSEECLFDENYQTDISRNKGGIITISENCIFEIIGSAFYNNTSNGTGGVIDAIDSYLKIQDSEFIGNEAYGDGGSIRHQMTRLADLLKDEYYFSSTNDIYQNSKSEGNGGISYTK